MMGMKELFSASMPASNYSSVAHRRTCSIPEHPSILWISSSNPSLVASYHNLPACYEQHREQERRSPSLLPRLRKLFWKKTLKERSREVGWSEDLRQQPCRLGTRNVGLRLQRTAIAKAAQGGEASVASESASTVRTLYPSLKSHQQGKLQVSERHTIHYEVFGNPNGKPALFLHGGPGAGCTNNHARFFDPAHYRIILFDQRGCGASRPRGCLIENTTWDLVADIEKLRSHLNVSKWIVLGGSWGVTLALAYAQAHPQSVAGLILRGVCLLREREIDWFYKQGASSLFPFGWEALNAAVEPDERSDLVAAFYRRLTSADLKVQEGAASAWLRWEMSLSSFSVSPFVYAWDGRQYSTIPHPTASSETAPAPPPSSLPALPSPGPQPQPGSPSHPSTASGSSPVTEASSPPTSETLRTPNGSFTHTASAASATSPSQSSSPQSAARPDLSTLATPSEAGTGVTSASAGVTSASGGATSLSGASGRGTQRGRGPADVGTALGGAEKMAGTAVQSRIECHYFYHKGFLREAQLLEDVPRIRHIPAIMVQGRYDFVCPVVNAFDLHRAWPEAELRVVPNAGHSMYEQGITHELIVATDRFKQLDY